MFAFSCFRVPTDLSMFTLIFCWVHGLVLITFNLWVKTEAHHIVKDSGWCWGDVFFERGALVFNSVFKMAPHSMYSIRYAGYYGLSLIVGSYAVFASLAAHVAQFGFLIFLENPHINVHMTRRNPLWFVLRSSPPRMVAPPLKAANPFPTTQPPFPAHPRSNPAHIHPHQAPSKLAKATIASCSQSNPASTAHQDFGTGSRLESTPGKVLLSLELSRKPGEAHSKHLKPSPSPVSQEARKA